MPCMVMASLPDTHILLCDKLTSTEQREIKVVCKSQKVYGQRDVAYMDNSDSQKAFSKIIQKQFLKKKNTKTNFLID